ncbi:MAG: LysR family transcriptional regulator [Bdellovibrionaceae bacterium]|nr:LysR family transcriptional regulator [Pseudobdellovibrionaceae bacterium]
MNDIKNLPPLEYLRSFVVFAEADNIVAASQALGISQPLLSKHLALFEELVGAPVFEFIGRKKTLTHLGQELLGVIAAHLRSLSADFHQALLKKAESKPLRIGGRKEILDGLIPHVRYQGSLAFRAMEGRAVEEGLLEKSIEIGISQKEIDSDRLIRKKLWADEFVLCWSSNLKIPDGAPLRDTLEILSGHRCFDYGENSALLGVLEKTGLTIKAPVTTFSDWRILVESMKNEKSWSLMPVGYAQAEPRLSWIKLPVELSRRSQFYVYYQKEFARIDWFSAVVQSILDIPRGWQR